MRRSTAWRAIVAAVSVWQTMPGDAGAAPPPPTIGNADLPAVNEYVDALSLDPTAPTEPAWLLGSQSSPRRFIYGPSAGYWLKNLNTLGPVDHNAEINLVESLQASVTSWPGWQQQILTPDWVFSTDADDFWYSLDNGATKISTGVAFAADDRIVQVPFIPNLAPGSTIMIHAEAQWLGADQGFAGYVQVAQSPLGVPEPSTIVLLLVGSCGLAAYHWALQQARAAR